MSLSLSLQTFFVMAGIQSYYFWLLLTVLKCRFCSNSLSENVRYCFVREGSDEANLPTDVSARNHPVAMKGYKYEIISTFLLVKN